MSIVATVADLSKHRDAGRSIGCPVNVQVLGVQTAVASVFRLPQA